jgi:hypothetical protein
MVKIQQTKEKNKGTNSSNKVIFYFGKFPFVDKMKLVLFSNLLYFKLGNIFNFVKIWNI